MSLKFTIFVHLSLLMAFFCFTFRNEQHQDALWKYSIECLKGYIDDNLLYECGFHVNDSEVKELFSSKKADA